MNKNLNIGEALSFREEYFSLAKDLCKRILVNTNLPIQKMGIAVGGESGSGKSTTAVYMEKELLNKGVQCAILHMDSYFKLPPKDNHKNRLKGMENVGPHEINMELLNEHITSFKNGVDGIEIPVVNYKENCFTKQALNLSNIQFLIVEGVYTFLLQNLDHKIFLSRTYKDTLENRTKRTREKYDPNVETILEIEHQIVSPMIEEADFIVKKNYLIADKE